MTRFLLAVLAAVLLVTGCGSRSADPPRSAGHAPRGGVPVTPSCPPALPRHAWLTELSDGGRVLWRTSLPAGGAEEFVSSTVQPVVTGGIVMAAQDGVVYGVRIAGGQRLWSWHGGQSVYGMWRWQNLVVVLTDQVSTHSRLTGVDTATGRVRWTLRIGGNGLLGDLVATADGGLAMVSTGGVLQVVSLADGRVRWHAAVGASPGLTAADGVVVFVGSGRATGYDDQTGRVRWRVPGLPDQPIAQVADGLAIVTSAASGGAAPTTMTAIVPGSGRVAWRFDPGLSLWLLGAGPGGLVVGDSNPAEHVYLVDPATGRSRWRTDAVALAGALVTATDVVAVEGRITDQVVDRSAATGRIRWTAPAATVVLPVVAVGGLVLVQDEPARSGQPAPLRAYRPAGGGLVWQADLPVFVQPPLVIVPGAILVQAADPGYACPAESAVGSATR